MSINIRLANQSDITAMVNLSYQKRRAYEQAYSKFWRYAEAAESGQSEWFKELLTKNDKLLSLRPYGYGYQSVCGNHRAL